MGEFADELKIVWGMCVSKTDRQTGRETESETGRKKERERDQG